MTGYSRDDDGKVYPDDVDGPSAPMQSRSKPNQVKAFAMKAYSYQKRQVFTNVCCISLCPLMMVMISAALGAVITNLIQGSSPPELVQYCSNNNSLNPLTGFPIFNVSDPNVYGANVKDGRSLNYLLYLNLDGINSNPGAATFGWKHPCTNWFGEIYPLNSPIYERNALTTGFAKMDSTYTSPPDGGWLTALVSDPTQATVFSNLQTAPWAITGAAATGLAAILGTKPATAALPLSQAMVYGQTYSQKPFPDFTSTSGGILGTLESRFYYNFTSPPTFKPVPYFVPALDVATATTPITSSYAMDDVLAAKINSLIQNLATLNKTILNTKNPPIADLLKFYSDAAIMTSQMPYGALFLDDFQRDKMYARMVLHFGSDIRVASSANYPTEGFRLLLQIAQLGQAFLRAFSGDSGGLKGATITQGVRVFPETRSTALNLVFSGYIGRILYPFGISFLLPIFVITLVKEKETRIMMMMKMNGMTSFGYYLSHYLTFLVLYFVSVFIFIVAGKATKLEFFSQTQGGVLVLLFFIWGNIQIVLAFFFSTFFNKSRIALVLTFLIVLCGVIISLVTEMLYKNGARAPLGYFAWPPFAFYRALTLINVASYKTSLQPYTIAKLTPSDEVTTTLWAMCVGYICYGILALYLAQVFPTEFGVQRPWYYPVTDLLKFFKMIDKKRKRIHHNSESELAVGIKLTDAELAREDDDVRAERARVDANEYDASKCLIVVNHMRKVYGGRGGLGPKLAVKDVTFAAEEGMVLGLLGPNGAGKTTLISMLTGIYPPSSGDAQVAGFDLRSSGREIFKVMGICPQFDILWEELSVSEHLYFYARLKGVGGSDEASAVATALAQVSLTALSHRLVKTLSGGEKRRLSIAIALMGDPKVVFLDEPTTGLDPEVRRLIWNIIQSSKVGKTVVLTTHSMEEAETLCQRIGIMAKGTLRCYANPLRLKQLYGSGFRLFFNSQRERTHEACTWIETVLPAGWIKVDAFATSTTYEFSPAPGVIPFLFDTLEKNKSKYGILDWGVSQTTLEEVFLRIITDNDADAD